MRRLNPIWEALALVVAFAGLAAAQGTGRLEGQILDLEGKPFPALTVQIKNPETGQSYTTKTDKDGKFVQIGLRTALYTVAIKNEKPPIDYQQQCQVEDGQENTLNINFKEIAAKLAAKENPEEVKKREEEQKSFEGMKTHFEAGRAAMTANDQLRAQLATAPADQKSAIQEKIAANCQSAIPELQQAEKAASPKDINNHATILANLGLALECTSKYPEAADTFQKAIDLKPQASFYSAMATDLARSGKFAEASTACEKGVALDPTTADLCWKNLGIVLSNAGKMKEATDPLKKATDANPKDAQAWFLLGGALAGQIDSKQEGEKLVYIIPPGTTEAYQKCIDLSPPNTPLAQQAKDALDGLAALSGGADITISKRKKKKT